MGLTSPVIAGVFSRSLPGTGVLLGVQRPATLEVPQAKSGSTAVSVCECVSVVCAPFNVQCSKDILLVCNTNRTRIQSLAFVQIWGQLCLSALLNLIRKVIYLIDFPRTNEAMSLITSVPLKSLRSKENDKVMIR